MPYCPSCGVESDKDDTPCPLCGFPIPRVPRDDPMDGLEITGYRNYYEHLKNEKRRRARRTRLIVFFILAGVSLYAALQAGMQDLLRNKRITFSPYVMSSVILFIILLYVLFGYVGRKKRILYLLFPAVTAYLFFLDIFDGSLQWFLDVGLPLSVLAFGWGTVNALVHRKRLPWQYAWTTYLADSAALCLLVELVVDLRMGDVGLKWSAIVVLSVFPIGLILVLLKLLLPNRFTGRLKRFFHV